MSTFTIHRPNSSPPPSTESQQQSGTPNPRSHFRPIKLDSILSATQEKPTTPTFGSSSGQISSGSTSTEGSTDAGQQESSGIDSRQQDSILRTPPPARPNDSLSSLQLENASLKDLNSKLQQENDDLQQEVDALKHRFAKMQWQCWDQV